MTNTPHLNTPFHRLTEDDIRQHYKDNLINAAGYLLYIRRITCHPNKKFVIPSVVKFCEEWGISRPSFYRAVDTLKSKGYMTWETTHGLIFTDSSKVVDFEQTGEQVSQKRTDDIENGRTILKTDARSQNLDSDIYIDRARPDITDKTDNADIYPPNPPEGETVQDCGFEKKHDSLESAEEHPQPQPLTTLLTKAEDLPQTEEAASSSIVPAQFDKPEQMNKATDEQIKDWFLEVYRQEKPSNFTEHTKIGAEQFRQIKRLIKDYPDEAIAKFRDALIWVREQKDGWWRDNNFSLGNLMSNGKISEYADKHATSMKHDPAYRDRVEGRAPSKDLKRIAPNANVSQAQYEEAYEAEKRKQELIDTYDYRPVIAKLRRF